MKNRQPWSIIKIFACFAIFFLLPISRLEGNQLQSTASTVLALNARLRALYLEVNTLHFSGSPIDKVNQLIAGIEELRAVDAEVALLGPGVTDYLLVDDANRSRAMAWVHAWAIFSRLAASSAMVNVDDTTRTKLIGANDKSALGLLLLTYRQLRVADGTSEPVRHLLSSGAHLSYLLAYKESWPTSPPEGIDHKYFLPSAEDILGSPKDAPELERGLLSLWRLVNLQLDTWQDLDVHYLKEGQTDRPFNDAVKKRAALLIETSTGKRGLVQANRAKTARVATWLQSVLDNPDLRYLDDGPASTGRVGAFKQRVNKLHLFLIFRQNISDEKYLADTLKQLQDLTKESDKDPRKVLRDLVDAATPIGDEKEEVLYEAGIWLRYLLLLSYQGEGQVVVPESQNSLESIWKTYNLPQSLTLTIPAGSTTAAKPEKPAPGPALLRWDSWPTPGSIAYVLNDVSHVTLEFLRFQERMATKEGIRFRSLDSASSRGDYMNALKTEIKAIEDADKNINIVDNTSKGLVLQTLLGTKKPWLHADNFVDVTFRNSDLYYDLVDVPAKLVDLQKQIGANIERDLAALQNINFIGSNSSPIAEQKNRLIFRGLQARSLNSYFWLTADINAVASAAVNITGNITAGSALVSQVSSLLGVVPGQAVAGNGINTGTFVATTQVVNGVNQITLSTAAILSVAADALSLSGKNTKDLFTFPLLLGTGGNSQANYTFDASETIWQLPNGLQGYALWDGVGNRVNFADPNIVIDTATPLGNKIINNANSCSRCHNQGLIPFIDQVRAHVNANAAQFIANDVQLVNAVYRGAAANAAIFTVDNRQYGNALTKLGISPGPDPMNVVTDRFLQNWDISQAAGFLFLTPGEFTQALNTSPVAKAALGTLLNGGSVTFTQFTGVLQQLIADARLFQDPLIP